MEKAIKKLMSKEYLTGEDVGRLMILDLLAAYKSLANGGSGNGVLSDDEKIKIVDSLTHPDDILHLNDFKGVHDYLATVPAVFDSYAKTYEICYLKLYHLLNFMKKSEEENIRLKSRPVIMTEKQFDDFVESGAPAPCGGIAILRDSPTASTENIDENGYFAEAEPPWLNRYLAESIILNFSDFIKETLDGMKDMLAECLARKKALELVGRYIKVPGVKILVAPIDEEKIDILNDYMSRIIESIRRYESDGYGKDYEIKLKAELSSMFTPIVLSELEPYQKAVVKARRMLNFSVIKNGSEAFTAILKKEWRDGGVS